MDLHTTLPDFPTGQYAGILSALEKAEVTVKELLLFDALEIAKQTQVPVNRVRKFLDHVLDALHKDLGVDRYREDAEDVELLLPQEEGSSGPGGEHAGVDVGSTFPVPFDQQCISTLDTVLDGALAGGIRAGYVTEIAGERYLPTYRRRSSVSWHYSLTLLQRMWEDPVTPPPTACRPAPAAPWTW